MDATERKFKIIELIISGSIPILLLIGGFLLTYKVEEIKNESTKKNQWESKWAENFLETYKSYFNDVTFFVSKSELLFAKIDKGTQNDPEGMKIQNEIIASIYEIHKEGISLKIQANSIFGKNTEIAKSIDKIYELIAGMINFKQSNMPEIYDQLSRLNNITGKAYDKIIK